MAGETVTTLIGNLTADPELRFTPGGHAVANFRVASTPRTFDKNKNEWVDGDPLFMSCSIWRQAAENVAESLVKGMRVIVVGRLRMRKYTPQDGIERTVVDMEVDEVGPALKYATAKVTRIQGQGQQRQQGGGQQQGGWGGQQGPPQNDPWAMPSGGQQGQGQQQHDPWGQPPDDGPPF